MRLQAGPTVPVSFRLRSAALAVTLLAGTVVVGLACGDEVAFGPQTVVSLTISQDVVSLVVGESVQLTAAPRDENGVAFSGPVVTWVSDNVAVAVVSEGGLLSAVGAGSAVITATVEGKQASATVTVTLQAAIGLSVTSIAFVGSQGGGDPPEQRIAISNVGGATFTDVGIGAITYNDGEPVGWLSTALNLTEDTITVRAVLGGLNVGTYQARVPVVAPGASNSPFNFVVSLSVSDVLEIVISATNLDFAVLEGTGDPPPQNVTITDLGGGPLFGVVVDAIVYQSGTNWLVADVIGNQLSVRPNVAGLPVGTYTADVRLTAPGAVNMPEVTVSLTVSNTPQIDLLPQNVNFAGTVGAPDPAAQNVLITSAGTGDLGAVTLGATAYGAGQPTGWLSSAITDTTVALQATLGVLTDGVYTATLPVIATAAGNSPQNINVTLVVGTSPAIGLSTSSVAAVAEEASGSGVFDTVTVSNIGGGALTQLALSNVTYGAGQPTGWLLPSLSGSVAPVALQLVSSVGALAPGQYTATVDVAEPAASNSPVTVSIVFTVTPAPRIVSSDTTLLFSAIEQGADPVSQIVTVDNGGGGTLSALSIGTIVYGSGSGWLSPVLNSTSVPASVTVQPVTGVLAPGVYTATIPVVSANAINTPHDIDVTFTVVALDPVIAFTDSGPVFTTTVGTDPTPQTVDIVNNGGGTLAGLALGPVTYGAGQPTGWLSPTLVGMQIQLPVSVTGLATGTYNASLPVTSTNAVNSPQLVSITLTVEDEPQISLSSTSLSFSATESGADPTLQSVIVTNIGGGTIQGLRVDSITFGPTGGWLAATVVGNNVQVQPSTGVLPAAVYPATIWVGSANAINAPTIAVTFTVQSSGTPLIVLTPSSLTPFTTEGTTDPVAQVVNITNGGTGSLTGLAVEPIVYGTATGWLTATPIGTTAPATVSIQAALGTLAVGTYGATVPISSTVPGVATQNINVSFTIHPATAAALTVVAQPSATANNDADLATQPSVRLENVVGVPVAQAGVTVSASIATQPGAGATLRNATAVTDGSGIATFSGLAITGQVGAYTLDFDAVGLTSATANAITINPGTASGATSTITANPSSIVADGVANSVVTVQLFDVSANPLSTGGSTVALSSTAGSLTGTTDNADGTYTATLTSPTVSGTATITGSVDANNIVDNATVTLTAGPASGTTSTIVANPTTVTANGVSNSSLTVQLFDVNGNAITAGGDVVILATSAGTLGIVSDLGSGQYEATLTSSVSVATATVTGTVNALVIVDNAIVSFVAGSGAAIEPVSTISLTGTVAAVVTPTPTVRVLDASSNPVQGVSVTFSAGAGSVSQSSVTTNASGQAATTWTLGTVAGTQTLTAVVAGLTGSPVTFTATASAGIASQVAITQQPTSAQAGVAFSPAFAVQIRDQFGNNVAEARSVTASIATGGPALLGTLTRSTSVATGAATFTGLSIGGVTGTRTLRFASGTLTAALSSSVSIGAGLPSQLNVVTQPSNVTSNVSFLTSVRLRDVYGNSVLASGVSVTVSKFSGTGTLTGVTTRSTSFGLATFSGLRIVGQTTGFGSHRLSFVSTGLTSAATNTFTVAVSLSHNVQPIFSASCATSGCHNGTFSPNLLTGNTHGQTVGVASTCTSGTRIVAGSSATSVLMLRMDGGSCGAMPTAGAISLALRSIVRTWIDEGANNN